MNQKEILLNINGVIKIKILAFVKFINENENKSYKKTEVIESLCDVGMLNKKTKTPLTAMVKKGYFTSSKTFDITDKGIEFIYNKLINNLYQGYFESMLM